MGSVIGVREHFVLAEAETEHVKRLMKKSKSGKDKADFILVSKLRM